MAFVFFAQSPAYAEPPFLQVSVETEPATLDWHRYRSSSDRFIVSFLMRGLMKYSATGQAECDLCLSYQVDATGKNYEFRIAPMERWSDGVPLEAKHFVDSFQRLLDSQKHFPAAGPFAIISKVKATGSHTVQIQLKSSKKEFLDLLTLTPSFPIRKDLISNAKNDRGEKMAQTATLGPYFLAEWDYGKRIVLEGNPFYMGDRPVFRVDLLFGSHQESVARFKEGKLDVLSNPTTEEIMSLSGSKLETRPLWSTRFLSLNTKSGPLQDASMRKAVSYSLERANLSALLKNGERPPLGLLPPGIPGYPLLTSAPPFDLTKAQAERHRAVAWPKEVEVTLLHSDQDTDQKVALWLIEALKKVHIKVSPKKVATRDFFEALAKQNHDLALVTWIFQTATSEDLSQLLGQKDGTASSQMAKTAEVDKNAVITLGYPSQSYLLGRRVQSFEVTPYGEPDLVKISLPQN